MLILLQPSCSLLASREQAGVGVFFFFLSCWTANTRCSCHNQRTGREKSAKTVASPENKSGPFLASTSERHLCMFTAPSMCLNDVIITEMLKSPGRDWLALHQNVFLSPRHVGQPSCTPVWLLGLKKWYPSCVWWFMPVIPTTQEAEVEGSPSKASPRQEHETPLKK
jgi:hypothetical protein